MYPVEVGTSFIVQQQVVGGGGAYNGSEYGRARAGLNTGDTNGALYLAANLFGAIGNGFTINVIDLGNGNPVSGIRVSMSGPNVVAILARPSIGATTSTAAQVAAALNAFPGIPFSCVAGGTGADVIPGVAPGTSPTSFAGGVDATYNDGATFKWAPAGGTNLGLFHFEQRQLVTVREMEFLFMVPSGLPTVTVSRVPLDTAYRAIMAEAIPVWQAQLSNAAPSVALLGSCIRLPPFWALLVQTSATLAGYARMDVRREPNYL